MRLSITVTDGSDKTAQVDLNLAEYSKFDTLKAIIAVRKSAFPELKMRDLVVSEITVTDDEHDDFAFPGFETGNSVVDTVCRGNLNDEFYALERAYDAASEKRPYIVMCADADEVLSQDEFSSRYLYTVTDWAARAEEEYDGAEDALPYIDFEQWGKDLRSGYTVVEDPYTDTEYVVAY